VDARIIKRLVAIGGADIQGAAANLEGNSRTV
jgi:hypothetical protein